MKPTDSPFYRSLCAARTEGMAFDMDVFAAFEGRLPLRSGIPLVTKQRTPTMPRLARDADQGIATNLLSYLSDILGPEQLDAVKTILAGGDVPRVEGAMDSLERRGAAIARRHMAAQADKTGTRRLARFPNANRLDQSGYGQAER